MSWPQAVETGIAREDFNDARGTYGVCFNLTDGVIKHGLSLPSNPKKWQVFGLDQGDRVQLMLFNGKDWVIIA